MDLKVNFRFVVSKFLKAFKITVGRSWMYQTCTEFGYFQTSTARPNLFVGSFPVEFYLQQCADIFGPRFVLI